MSIPKDPAPQINSERRLRNAAPNIYQERTAQAHPDAAQAMAASKILLPEKRKPV
jgi:hypothetical protein